MKNKKIGTVKYYNDGDICIFIKKGMKIKHNKLTHLPNSDHHIYDIKELRGFILDFAVFDYLDPSDLIEVTSRFRQTEKPFRLVIEDSVKKKG